MCQFSSPPSSCRYSTCLLSKAQKCWRMPRLVSLVTGLAAEGSLRGPTHTLSTPSLGATNDTYLPSGERRACAFSGLPNSAERGITGTPATFSAAVVGAWAADSAGSSSAATAALRRYFFMEGYPGTKGEMPGDYIDAGKRRGVAPARRGWPRSQPPDRLSSGNTTTKPEHDRRHRSRDDQ